MIIVRKKCFLISRKHLFKFIVAVLLFFIGEDMYGQHTNKFLFPWYIYTPQSSFEEIKPYKDIIKSLSVFGNPPISFIQQCHDNQIEVYHAVGGSEKDLDTPEKMNALIKKYIEDCRSNTYDGIDMDFEALKPSLREKYSVFLKELSKGLHDENKKLSHCVGFYPTFYIDSGKNYFYNPQVIAQTCDLIRVMCYDMYYAPGKTSDSTFTVATDPGIGPTSTASFTRDAMHFWLRYAAPQKLVMGLPAYSNDYEISATHIAGNQVYKSYPENAKQITAATWLWLEKLNMYVYTDTANNTHLFYASDDKSTEALLKVGAELKINNVGFWHLATIDNKTWKIVEEWSKKAEKK